MDTTSIHYRTAFRAYLRRGTPIGLSLQLLETKNEDRPTTHYIWRTRGDGKVRDSHAANDGKIFAWDDPPPTGPPGEDHNCRCTAEPYYPEVNEHMNMVMSGVSDTGNRWNEGVLGDFFHHYFFGDSKPVRLRDTGRLSEVVEEYQSQVQSHLLGQIADVAREQPGSSFTHSFGRSYDMQHIVFDLGGTPIHGVAHGASKVEQNGALRVSGRIDFQLRDRFEDVVDIRNMLEGNIELPFGRPYTIYDDWQGQFSGIVNADRDRSEFRYDEEDR